MKTTKCTPTINGFFMKRPYLLGTKFFLYYSVFGEVHISQILMSSDYYCQHPYICSKSIKSSHYNCYTEQEIMSNPVLFRGNFSGPKSNVHVVKFETAVLVSGIQMLCASNFVAATHRREMKTDW
jgi:hypothetical protein